MLLLLYECMLLVLSLENLANGLLVHGTDACITPFTAAIERKPVLVITKN